MPKLYIMAGLPFAGKSTLAGFLSDRHKIPIVSVDQINHARGIGLDDQPIKPEEWPATYSLAYDQVGQILDADQSVIFDAAHANQEERQITIDVATGHRADYLVIYVDVAPALAKRRLIENRINAKRHQVPMEHLDRVISRLEPPTAGHRCVIYAGQDPEAWLASLPIDMFG